MRIATGTGTKAPAGGPRHAARILCTALVAACALAACRGGGDRAVAGPPALATSLPAPPLAEPAAAEREGVWQGGPEPVSGKLRSGVVTWWRFAPAVPSPGTPFDLVLRFEDVHDDTATALAAVGDGAQWASAEATRAWRLAPGRPTEVRLRLVAPPGASYLHVTTQQRGRSSVRSILLALPGKAPAVASRGDYATDARGEPVVRMPAGR